MTAYSVLAQLLALLIAVLGAPLLTGWINQCRAWLGNRSAPPLLLPYRTLHKLFHKDIVYPFYARALWWVWRLFPWATKWKGLAQVKKIREEFRIVG